MFEVARATQLGGYPILDNAQVTPPPRGCSEPHGDSDGGGGAEGPIGAEWLIHGPCVVLGMSFFWEGQVIQSASAALSEPCPGINCSWRCAFRSGSDHSCAGGVGAVLGLLHSMPEQ